MYRIGIDIGSTYTKYCVLDANDKICCLYSEKTPVRQKEYFEKKVEIFLAKYGDARIISCGYGRKNINAIKNISELTALAVGSFFQYPQTDTVLDIGGQDTKVITHKSGKLLNFFINEKCAAGSGMFLAEALHMLNINFTALELSNISVPDIRLSSVCAVFAKSEIVSLIADNISPESIVQGVLWQILQQAKALLRKVNTNSVLLSGGLAQIPGIEKFAEKAIGCKCYVNARSAYLSAIGCALYK